MPGTKAAIIGAGFIAPAHVEALRRIGIEVAGIAGSNPERVRPKAEAMRIARVYDDYHDILADPEVTAVHICTPNRLHYPIAKEAISAGKHVVCEKPLTVKLEQSDELVRLAREAGLVNAVTFNIRYYPLVQEMRARIRRGDIGKVYIVQGHYLQDWLLEDTDWNWRVDPDSGGQLRVVSDIGSHWIDLAMYVTGRRVEAVFADLATFVKTRKKPLKPVETYSGRELRPEEYVETPITTEDYAAILLRLDDGTRGSFTVSQVCAGHKNQIALEINGASGTYSWDGEHPNDLWIGRRDTPNELLVKDPVQMLPETRQWARYPGGHAEGYPDTFMQFCRSVYAAIEGDKDAVYPTFADGANEQRIGEAVARSVREGRWVEVEGDE